MPSRPITIDEALEQLTLDDKVALTAGQDVWTTMPNRRLGIPSITFSDGPHGVRGTKYFNGQSACLLPSATAMGATFDVKLLHQIGSILAEESRQRGVHGLLAPTVNLQRSPLIGRGFEAFGEDPLMSGVLAGEFVNGVQKHKVASVIKHYAAHDQSDMSVENNIRASARTLREMHLLPFQIAIKNSNPWGIMTAYNKINGLHASEHPQLLQEVLRDEWNWNGLIIGDWGGTYSTAEAINAGLDLEMPGPTEWRGSRLTLSVLSRKVKPQTLDARVRHILELVEKVTGPGPEPSVSDASDIKRQQNVCRKVASESIVLLKNDKRLLPLQKSSKKKYGLIGTHFKTPAISGGGSADLIPYYVSTPYDAIVEVVGEECVRHEPGCYVHRYCPLLSSSDLNVPDTNESGFRIEWFAEDPSLNSKAVPVATDTTTQAYMYFADSLPDNLPSEYFVRVTATYTAPKSMRFQFGLCVSGVAKLHLDGKELIDLWTTQPEKTDDTPIFNSASMEQRVEVDLKQAQTYHLVVSMSNVSITGGRMTGGLRIGGLEVIDEDDAISKAVALATSVDVPILLTGTNSDWEYEGCDRKTLKLPGRIDELVTKVLAANPDTIIVTQSGCAIAMPWANESNALVHAWFGGQETGHAIADVLFGDANPSGRLPLTFPHRVQDTPTFLTFGKADYDIYYGEGVFVGYRYYEKIDRPPLFYFGYGLSYTKFEYANLVVPAEFTGNKDHVMTVSVDVRNAGDADGAEVVQFYVADVESSVIRPMKELKAFRKVYLAAGATTTVDVELDKYSISFWSEWSSSWVAEKGQFRVIVSRSADPRDEIMEKEFLLPTTFRWNGI